MYKYFGYLNIVLLLAVTSQFCVRMINQWIVQSNSPNFQKVMVVLHKIHKPAALALLVSTIVHGWLALAAFALHTGTIAAAFLFITALFGLLFYILHKKGLLQWHRIMALITTFFVVVHLLFPWLIYWKI